VIEHWPVARRAAAVIAAPVFDYNMATVAAALSAGVGGLLLLGGASPPASLGSQLGSTISRERPSLPPLVMADQEGGGIQRLTPPVTAIPWPRVMADHMTAGQIEQLATTVGGQMRALGVNVDLAPVLDVDGGNGPNASDPDGLRSLSSIPSVAARDGVAFWRGLQAGGVIPVVKHFPGLGGASGNTDYGLADTLPIGQLQSGGLAPFRAAIAAGAPAVMVANARVPGLSGLPASLSTEVIGGLLRQQLGFSGLVVTDSLSAGAIAQAGYSVPQAAATAVAAGADMILFGSTLTPAQTAMLTPDGVRATVSAVVAAIVRATQTGALSPARLTDAVEQVVAADHADLCDSSN
jgi:beta-N-acetylhexosaminidase